MFDKICTICGCAACSQLIYVMIDGKLCARLKPWLEFLFSVLIFVFIRRIWQNWNYWNDQAFQAVGPIFLPQLTHLFKNFESLVRGLNSVLIGGCCPTRWCVEDSDVACSASKIKLCDFVEKLQAELVKDEEHPSVCRRSLLRTLLGIVKLC